MPPGGSSSTARRFIADTQKLSLVLVSPGGSCVTARRFLEKFQKPDFNSDFQIKCNPNPLNITIQSIKNQTINRNSPNLDFLAQFDKCATSSFFANLLLALLPIQTQNLTKTHQNSPFVLYFWCSFSLAKTFPNTQLLPFKRCFKFRSIMQKRDFHLING